MRVIIAAILGCLIVYSYLAGTFAGVMGWPSIMVTILFIGGLQIAFIGIIGQYIGRAYLQTKGRPLYIVKEKIGFK